MTFARWFPDASVYRSDNPANRLGLDYRDLAGRFAYRQTPITDVHTHINSVEAGRLLLEVADLFGVERIWSMSRLDVVDDLQREFGNRLAFIAVPNYARKDEPDTFSTQWLRDIETFASKGARVCKFWAAPRGRDFSTFLTLDHPIRIEAMKLARSLGMIFMTHVADPDTWFATTYSDAGKYGRKAEQYEPLVRLLDQFGDVPWIAAHMGGDPEHLDHLQGLLDRHPNLYLDTSATKWMVRELSRQPEAFRDFARRNADRLLFGSDIVAGPGPGGESTGFDLFASRYWALRTLLETDYDGPSPIVDPDFKLVAPTAPADATAHLRGAAIDAATLRRIYHDNAQRLLPPA